MSADVYEQVVQYVIDKSGVTIIEISRILEENGIEAKGDLALFWPYDPIVIWASASTELMGILQRLIQDDRIEITNTQPLVYMIDGMMSSLPIAKVSAVERGHRYKSERWLPVVFNKA